MSAGVSNGQLANDITFNTAFMARNGDTSTTGVVDLNNVTDANSGPEITNTQRYINELAGVEGVAGIGDLTSTTYSDTSAVANGDTRKIAIGKLSAEFNPTSGHRHSGTDSPKVSVLDVIDINQFVAELQMIAVPAASGISMDLTTIFAGKSPNGDDITAGVITTAPNNRCEIRDSATGLVIEDSGGDKVYGRLTFSTSVLTLTFFTIVSGTETAFTMPTHNINLFYREVFSLASRPTIPADLGALGSIDLTAEIIDATTTQKGKVQLSAQAPPAVGSTASAGTANGSVANADHTHQVTFPGFAKQVFRPTILDNQATDQVIHGFDKTTLKGIFITYHLNRGVMNSKTGTVLINVNSDQTLVVAFDTGIENGSCGITFDANLAGSSGAEVQFLYKSTNTGVNADLTFEATLIA